MRAITMYLTGVLAAGMLLGCSQSRTAGEPAVVGQAAQGRTAAMPGNLKKPARAVLFVIDGLHWDAPRRLELKNIQALIPQGAYCEKTWLLLPYDPQRGDWTNYYTCSLPNPLMLNGSLFVTKESRLIQSAFKQAGLKTAHATNCLAYRGVDKDSDISMVRTDTDDAAVAFAIKTLTENDVQYLRIHLQSTGSGGMRCSEATDPSLPYYHNIWGAGSPYIKAAKNADMLVGRFVAELKKMNKWDDTLLIVTADHGQAYCGWHPLLQEEGWVCPMIMVGPGIVPGKKLAYAEHTDIVPTICALMGVPAPNQDGGAGQVLTEAIAGMPTPATPRRQLTRELDEGLRDYYTLRARMTLAAEFKDPALENVALLDFRKIQDLDRITEWYKLGTLAAVVENNQKVVADMRQAWEASPAAHPLVGLDRYYNCEPAPHYTWEVQQDLGSYSKFGQVIESLGGTRTNVFGPPTADKLKNLEVYIITDPDNEKESPKPNYIAEPEIGIIENWVKQGGTLILMGNNKGNAEFTHLNQLAGKFGVQFIEGTANDGAPDFVPEAASGAPAGLPGGLLIGVKQFHIVGMCALDVKAPAQPVLTMKNQPFLAVASVGKGKVVFLGDPFCYDEYIEHQNNRQGITNLMKWVLAEAK